MLRQFTNDNVGKKQAQADGFYWPVNSHAAYRLGDYVISA